MPGLADGFKYPRVLIERAQRELDQFVDLLRSLGVTVRRPDVVEHRRHFGTPDRSSRGFCNTCPRDSLLVIGDEVIETPMAWPCRYFETHSYRALLKDYFRRGARGTAAPKPQLTDALIDVGLAIRTLKGHVVTGLGGTSWPVATVSTSTEMGIPSRSRQRRATQSCWSTAK